MVWRITRNDHSFISLNVTPITPICPKIWNWSPSYFATPSPLSRWKDTSLLRLRKKRCLLHYANLALGEQEINVTISEGSVERETTKRRSSEKMSQPQPTRGVWGDDDHGLLGPSDPKMMVWCWMVVPSACKQTASLCLWDFMHECVCCIYHMVPFNESWKKGDWVGNKSKIK